MSCTNTLKVLARRLFPTLLYNYFSNKISNISVFRKISIAHKKYERNLEEIKKKNKIRVAFLLVNTDIWKYESLYYEFEKNELYEPVVVICPFSSKGPDFFKRELKKSIDYCESNQLNYFLAYDEVNKITLDIIKAIDFDIVFLANPNQLTPKGFEVSNFKDKLTCYVPYSFRIDTLYKYNYDNEMVNLTWLNFYETPIHSKLAKLHARNKGKNVIVSGFPHLNSFTQNSKNTVWKQQTKTKKKIIWGPHWTIKGFQNTGLDWSCFLMFAERFLQLSTEFEDVAQFAMKPHPFLRKTLEDPKLWGVERTRKYFDEWNSKENCQIIDGEYVDLFIESDALIHDSGSFLSEYLILNKPVAYTMGEHGPLGNFNDYGLEALKWHYLVQTEVELRNFIVNVISEQDPMHSGRSNFINAYLLPTDGISSSAKIVQTITEKIKG